MTARARAAEQTGRDILSAVVELWREHPIDEITLQEIAKRADVSVQTVIRRFGSKDGVLEACIEQDAADIRVQRDQAAIGDVESAVDVLLRHYERDGDAVVRTLALEGKVDAANALIEAGRIAHRQWCARVFAPYLPDDDDDSFDPHLDAFVAATDLYLWKLLRRDLGRTASETKMTLRMLLEGLIKLASSTS
jgi:AcrR family transcriptional regulator